MTRSRIVRIQLAIFLVLTVVGVSVAGVRYAGIGDELFSDRYRVRANFADAGGIFEGAQVTYRGVTVGEVEELRPTRDGVQVVLLLEAEPRIPDDATATVANRSAIGEQYVDLEPGRNSGPYLSDHDEPVIARDRTAIPLSTHQLIYDLDQLVDSVPKRDLVTVIDELGNAFAGTGHDLSRIVDSGNDLIESADEHLDETIGLLDHGSQVLATQRESGSAIRNFSDDLADLSETLKDSDADLRTVLDSGVATGRQLTALVEENEDDVPALLTNLTTGAEVVRARLDGVQHILILYPYVVRGGYTVVDKDPVTGQYTAHFGMAISAGPRSCREGYEGTERRQPERTGRTETNTDAHCADPETNMRGAQHAPAPDQEEPVPGPDGDSGDEDRRDSGDGGDGDGGDGGDGGRERDDSERPRDDGERDEDAPPPPDEDGGLPCLPLLCSDGGAGAAGPGGEPETERESDGTSASPSDSAVEGAAGGGSAGLGLGGPNAGAADAGADAGDEDTGGTDAGGSGAGGVGAGGPLIAPYDPVTGQVQFPDGSTTRLGSTGGQHEAFGEDSWKWLLIGPLTD